MISVVIPISNLHEYTNECIDTLLSHADMPVDIVVIDNASDTPYVNKHARIIRNEKNAGFWPSMLQGIAHAHSNIVLCMHNDVFIWEQGFDRRLIAAFQLDPRLALAGFFGSRGVAVNGGRAYPESNMQGRKYGQHGNLHGHVLTDEHPSVVFDSMAMCFRRDYLYSIPYEDIPPHHWTDRLVTLRLLAARYHCTTIGIAFDHGGGFTSTAPKIMNTFTEDWCREKGLELDINWDHTLYKYGEAMYQREFLELTSGHSQLWVTESFDLYAK